MALREIIFRGKRLNNGEWVDGYLYEHEPPLVGIAPENYVPEPSKWFIARTGFADWNMPRPVEFVEVDPSTVGQFTGLTDKNGKRIFEGDIVRFAERRIGGEDVSIVEQVGFDEGGFCTHRYFLNNWLRNGLYGITKLEGIEVIGNIHDNKSLLNNQEAGE